VERCSEATQRRHHASGVLWCRLDPDVEVAGGSRLRVRGNGVGTNDQEARFSLEQREQQISKVLVHQDLAP